MFFIFPFLCFITIIFCICFWDKSRWWKNYKHWSGLMLLDSSLACAHHRNNSPPPPSLTSFLSLLFFLKTHRHTLARGGWLVVHCDVYEAPAESSPSKLVIYQSYEIWGISIYFFCLIFNSSDIFYFIYMVYFLKVSTLILLKAKNVIMLLHFCLLSWYIFFLINFYGNFIL